MVATEAKSAIIKYKEYLKGVNKMLKKLLLTVIFTFTMGCTSCLAAEHIDLGALGVTGNAPMTQAQYDNAREIIVGLQQEMRKHFKKGSGPFRAAVFDENGKLLSEDSNSVVSDKDCTCHAEMNAVRLAQKNLGTYDLSKYNASIYVTAEPCIMCMGAIMWSGIKNIYYGVHSKDVEAITGFDEGYKPEWFEQFKNRGIKVYGGIEQELGKQYLQEYVEQGHIVYKPER